MAFLLVFWSYVRACLWSKFVFYLRNESRVLYHRDGFSACVRNEQKHHVLDAQSKDYLIRSWKNTICNCTNHVPFNFMIYLNYCCRYKPTLVMGVKQHYCNSKKTYSIFLKSCKTLDFCFGRSIVSDQWFRH